jgi:hypothetical protein
MMFRPTRLLRYRISACVLIAGGIAAVIRMFTEPVAIKLALLSSVVSGALAAMAYNISDRIAADMRPEAGRSSRRVIWACTRS